MKELILRFKESFKKYDFESNNNNNITVLLDMINCILEMMSICSSEDHPKIKKLTSFLKLLSTDFCQDILDIHVIMDVYCLNVEGILEYLEEKYYVPEENGDGTKTVKQFNTEIGELCNEIIEDIPKNEEQHEFFDNYKCQTFAPEPDVEVQQNNKGDPNIKDDKTLFNLLKETSRELRKNFIKNNKINLTDLRSIQSMVKLSNQHRIPSIRVVSTTLENITDVLIKSLELNINMSTLTNKRIIHDFDFITIVEFDDR